MKKYQLTITENARVVFHSGLLDEEEFAILYFPLKETILKKKQNNIIVNEWQINEEFSLKDWENKE